MAECLGIKKAGGLVETLGDLKGKCWDGKTVGVLGMGPACLTVVMKVDDLEEMMVMPLD